MVASQSNMETRALILLGMIMSSPQSTLDLLLMPDLLVISNPKNTDSVETTWFK